MNHSLTASASAAAALSAHSFASFQPTSSNNHGNTTNYTNHSHNSHTNNNNDGVSNYGSGHNGVISNYPQSPSNPSNAFFLHHHANAGDPPSSIHLYIYPPIVAFFLHHHANASDPPVLPQFTYIYPLTTIPYINHTMGDPPFLNSLIYTHPIVPIVSFIFFEQKYSVTHFTYPYITILTTSSPSSFLFDVLPILLQINQQPTTTAMVLITVKEAMDQIEVCH